MHKNEINVLETTLETALIVTECENDAAKAHALEVQIARQRVEQ